MTMVKQVFKMVEGCFKGLYIVGIKNGSAIYGGSMGSAKKITKPFKHNVEKWVKEKYKIVKIEIKYKEIEYKEEANEQ